mgnify:FL=1
MKTLISLLAVFFLFLPMSVMAQDDHGNKTFHVQAWDFTDSNLLAGSNLDMEKGVPCADVLAILMGQGRTQKYELLEATGVQGPPGVTYTLINYSGQVAIVKCGTSGCGSGDDGGHEPGQH